MSRALLSLTCAAVLLGGCSDYTDPDPTPLASIKLLNGASEAPALDLLYEGEVVHAGVPYLSSSAYMGVPEGVRELAIRNSQTLVVLQTVEADLEAGRSYLIMASGSALNVAAATGDTGQVRTDRVNLRLVNLADVPDSNSNEPPQLLDVHITAPGVDLSGRQSEMTLDARFPAYSTLWYFNPGTLVVRFRRVSDGVVVADTGPLNLGAGDVRAVMLERLGDGTYRVAVVTEE